MQHFEVYVYCYKWHARCNEARCTQWLEVFHESENLIVKPLDCQQCEHTNHNWLLPYFKDNPSIKREARGLNDDDILSKLVYAKERSEKDGMFAYKCDFDEHGMKHLDKEITWCFT